MAPPAVGSSRDVKEDQTVVSKVLRGREDLKSELDGPCEMVYFKSQCLPGFIFIQYEVPECKVCAFYLWN
jgi:hypothetical protein